MGGMSRKMDMEELMTYSNNLIEVLKEEKDVDGLKHFLGQSVALRSQCERDFNEVQNSNKDYEKKIYVGKQKAAAAISETASDAELDSLQKELDEEQKLERMLKEDLRAIITEIDELEQQRINGEKEMQTIKKFEKDELRAPMRLSMYASVTNVIPCLDDLSKISGYIVARDKKVVEKFEFDQPEVTTFDTCNNIWKMINL